MVEARKIALISSASGNGKTTLWRELARRLDVPFVEMDGIVHGPAWVEKPDELLREEMTAIVATDGWVIDGCYQHKIGNLVLDAAELVVWLDLPLRVWTARLAGRTWRRMRSHEELWNGNRESVRMAIGGRDSLFGYALRTHFRRRREWPTELREYRPLRLRTPAEVERFLLGAGS